MAVSTINPWSAGAVVLDQRPFLAFYERQMAREQAKNDALENYFKNQGSNITSAGMRSQDVPGLLQMNKAWQDHYIQNKDAILHPQKDNGKALNEYNSGYQNQLALMNESKGAQKKTDKLGELKFNKDFQYVFDDPDILDQIKSHELPIGDPKRKDFDITTAMLPPKPLTAKDREEYSKYIIGDTKQDKIPGAAVNIGNFQTQTPITHQYSEQNKKLFGDRAANFYNSANKDWKADANNLFKEVQHNPVLHDQLNKISKVYYGHDIDNPRDAFIAKTILDHDVKTMEYQKGENTYGRELAMENIRFGHQKQLKKEDQNLLDNWVVNYFGNRIAEAKIGQPKSLSDPDLPLGARVGYEIKPDAVLMKGLSRNGIEPDAVYVTPDNKIMPIFYKYKEDFDDKGKKIGTSIQTDANGNVQYDKDLSKPMDIDQAYLSLGYKGQTKKQLGSTMQSAYQGSQKETKVPETRKYNIDGKTYTHDQLKKMYSEEKIKEYIDAGIIK